MTPAQCPSWSQLHLLAVGSAPESGPRFAVRRGTRQTFRVSPELASSLERGTLDEELRAEVETEVARLQQYGFWYTAHPEQLRRRLSTVTVGIHLVHGCNLACTYCNVNKGTYGDSEVSMMSEEVALASVEMLRNLCQQHETPCAVLSLFGGEPTLNWPVLERAVIRFREVFPDPPHDVWLVTNGTLLSRERAEFLREHNAMVVLSLDGDRRIHDSMRRFAGSGQGSYDAVMAGMACLKEMGTRYTVRATWVPGNADRLEQLRALRSVTGDAFQVTVAIDFNADEDGYREYGNTVSAEWESFAAGGYEGPAPASAALFADFVLRAEWAPPMECPAGRDGFGVTPAGDIYGCQVLAAKKRLRLGNVLDKGLEPQRCDRAAERMHYDDPGPACAQCPVNGFCGGPCNIIRPLKQPRVQCEITAMEIAHACRYAAASPLHRLTDRYRYGLTTPEEIRAVERGAAIRDILWERNRHLKPLALCPGPSVRPALSAAAALESVAP